MNEARGQLGGVPRDVESGRPLSAREWEAFLVSHYLSSDCPFGSAPLCYLDVSGEQLAKAIGVEVARSDAVVEQFLKSFSETALRDVLAKGVVSAIEGVDGPGWFRFLVLTCVVAAAPQRLAADTDYRERLRNLLGLKAAPVDLSGIATLWRRLSKWCDAARLKGKPFRRIQLPDPGWMKQIGHAQAIAFPSRRDREHLSSLIAQRHGSRFCSPSSAILEVKSHRPWSQGFESALEDFEKRYRRGDRLLSEHAFWILISDLLRHAGRLVDSDAATAMELWLIPYQDESFLLDLRCDRAIRGLPLDKDTDDSLELPFRLTTQFTKLIELLKPWGQTSSDKSFGRLLRAVGSGLLPFVEHGWAKAEMVRFAADARSEVGQQPNLFTCMAEPFVGRFGKVIAQLSKLILFHGSSLLCELNNRRNGQIGCESSGEHHGARTTASIIRICGV
jgi:hypothetical protein